MKKWMLLFTFVSLVAYPVLGQERGQQKEKGRNKNQLLRILDTDRDGVLSAEEIRRAPERLKALDSNHDGRLTADDLRGGRDNRNTRNRRPPEEMPKAEVQGKLLHGTLILGRPTDSEITVNILPKEDLDAFFEYGETAGDYAHRTDTVLLRADAPVEQVLDGLKPNTRYYYRMRYRAPGRDRFFEGRECTFHTQRPPGSTFIFALQGDSHPERYGKMYDPDLYLTTMNNVSKDQPDFYITMGDDFSIDRLVNQNMLSQANVDQVYAHQRAFLGIVGRSSPLFLVNGNHEQAARHFLDNTPDNPAVLAGKARTRFYSLPAPNAFYSGDSEQVDLVGLLRDYYAWTWGDALFVVMDPYWHSPVPIDSAGGDKRQRDTKGTKRRGESRGKVVIGGG